MQKEVNTIPVVNIKDMIPIEFGKYIAKDKKAFPCITARYYKGILNNQEEAAVGVLIGCLRDDIPIFGIDKSEGGVQQRMIANTLTAREDRGVSKHKQEGTAVAIPLIIKIVEAI